MDDRAKTQEDFLSDFVSSKGIDARWKDCLYGLSSSFAKPALSSYTSWAKYSQSYSIYRCQNGEIEDSLFLKGAIIESGVVNCELSRIVAHPSVIIIKKCVPDASDLDQSVASQIIETLQKLKITIVLCNDQIPSILVAKFMLHSITAIQKVSLEKLNFIRSFSGLPLLDSFASIYSSLPCVFYGFFFATVDGFEPQVADGIELPKDVRILVKNGFKIERDIPSAFFVHNNQFALGSFILYGCENKEIPDILSKLLEMEFSNVCIAPFLRSFGFTHYIENPFNTFFPFSLILWNSPDFSTCTPFLNDAYKENDLSLRNFFLQACTGTPETEPLYEFIIDETVFQLEKKMTFRLLHDNFTVTFSTFPGNLMNKKNPPAFFWPGAYQPILTDQFFEMSFSTFSRLLFHFNELPSFGIILEGIGLFIERSNSKIIYDVAKPVKPPPKPVKPKIGAISKSNSEEELSSFKFFANVIYAAEVIIAQSLSKCASDKAGPYFLSLQTFVTSFGSKVAAHSDWECSLRSQFFLQMFKWYITIEQMSPQLKNIKINEKMHSYCTSTCRFIVLKLLLFIDFPHIDTLFETLETFDEKACLNGVPSEWLFDKIEKKKPKNPSSEEHLVSLTTLFFASACNYFYPQIVILHSVNLNISEPATIIAFALASDRFFAHVLNQCPSESSETIFNGSFTNEEFAKVLSLPDLSQPFTMELDEKYPSPWPQPSHTVSVDIQSPVEFLALMSFYGYTLENIVNILKTGHATVTIGGKSDAKYFETSDHRFLIKTISQVEMSEMPSFLPYYFKYMCANTTNLLTRVLGVFTINVDGIYNYKCILMENLRYGFNGNDILLYDFKGAARNRLIDENDQSVLLDTNYEHSSLDNRVILSFTNKNQIIRQLNQDAHFLASHNIMDYSLVVVLSHSEMLVRLGIVDIFRTYTLDKALETWVKKTPIYTDNHIDPTIISPDSYCRRFVKALDKYFYHSPCDKDVEAVREYIMKNQKEKA